MLKNIELKMNEIEYICKKHELNMDHFWLEVNRQFNLKQAKKCRESRKTKWNSDWSVVRNCGSITIVLQ